MKQKFDKIIKLERTTMPKKQYLQFKSNMYNDIKEDCWIQFECPFCRKMVWTDSVTEYTECECGEKFHVSAVLYHVIESTK